MTRPTNSFSPSTARPKSATLHFSRLILLGLKLRNHRNFKVQLKAEAEVYAHRSRNNARIRNGTLARGFSQGLRDASCCPIGFFLRSRIFPRSPTIDSRNGVNVFSNRYGLIAVSVTPATEEREGREEGGRKTEEKEKKRKEKKLTHR